MKVLLATIAMTATAMPAYANTEVVVTRAGSQPSTAGSPDNFTGSVRVDDRFSGTAPARIGGATVTFEPGARTAWHSHPLGQTLIVTAGARETIRSGRPRLARRAGKGSSVPAFDRSVVPQGGAKTS